MSGSDDRVRSKAYEIWEREGRPDGRAEENWLQAESELNADGTTEEPMSDKPTQKPAQSANESANEGEGSRSAAADYNRRTEKFVESGHAEQRAREAADALAGPERESLKKAEAAGKRRSKGEDPAVKR